MITLPHTENGKAKFSDKSFWMMISPRSSSIKVKKYDNLNDVKKREVINTTLWCISLGEEGSKMRLQESHLIHLAVKTKRARLIYNKGLPSQLQYHFQNVFINVKRMESLHT